MGTSFQKTKKQRLQAKIFSNDHSQFCFIGVSLKVGVDSASFAADLQCGIRKECLFEDTKLAATAEQTFSVERNLEETSCEECSSLCEETDVCVAWMFHKRSGQCDILSGYFQGYNIQNQNVVSGIKNCRGRGVADAFNSQQLPSSLISG